MQKDKPRDERYARLLATRAEQAVIGVMLLAPKAYGKIASLLNAEDFEDKRYRAIFEAASRLEATGKPLDSVTLLRELNLKQSLEEKAAACLADCAVAVPNTRNLATYCEMVKEASRRRQLVKECEKCVQLVLSGSGSVDASEQLRKLFEEMK